ncbi:alpha/beta hydrolase family protein [Streptomyces sp. NPDC053560]|uniref:alpha/beta hydrolase family protein n=1 Tax=Streptomyces sp. NPDC053560 TaxID=3365711 RepID=UPI0037CDD690
MSTLRIALDGDAALYTQADEAFTCFHLDPPSLTVEEHHLDGKEDAWQVALPDGASSWTLTDVLAARTETGSTCYLLTVQDADEAVLLIRAARGAAVRVHSPLNPGEVVHWADAADVVVLREDQGPWPPLLHAEPFSTTVRPFSTTGARGTTINGSPHRATWLDGTAHQALIAGNVPEKPSLAVWDLVSGGLRDLGHAPVSDARFFLDTPDHALLITTRQGIDRAHRLDLTRNAVTEIPTPGSGRLQMRTTAPHGIGLHGLSTTGGTRTWWIGPDGDAQQCPGAVPPDPDLPPITHTWLGTHTSPDTHTLPGAVPALIHNPPAHPTSPPTSHPTSAVISLHGGPESLERDELRWDGLYRHLLHDDTLVIALNYTGSTGYGAEHLRAPWRRWSKSFAADLASCLALTRERGIPPHRTALLGGSFGGSLALLGCVLEPSLAGAVASAPMADIVRQAARAGEASPHYPAWFAERYSLTAATPAERAFDPAHLTTTTPRQRITILHGENDEVTSYQDSAALVARALAKKLPWTLLSDASGHTPDTAATARLRHDRTLQSLRETLALDGRSRPLGP